MIKLCVADISTVLEPSTAVGTATVFTGLIAGTLGTSVFAAESDKTRRRGRFYGERGSGVRIT